MDDLGERLGLAQRAARDAKRPIIIVFEGWRGSHRSAVINTIMQYMDARGFDVYSTVRMEHDEKAQPFFTFFWQHLPADGNIAVYHRSWYYLKHYHEFKNNKDVVARYTFDHINGFEKVLTDDNYIILKFFLHLSEDEQKKSMEDTDQLGNLFYEKLQSVLTRAKNNEKKVAVLFADLTNFNRINDTLGHSAGDTLLKIVGDRLIKIFSDQDFVARIGGDEFAVIVSNVKNAEAAASFARLMIESTLAPIQIENTEVNVGACVGISIFPDDGDDADKMVNYADMALRTASHSSPNSYFFFSQEMNAETEDHLALERDLRKAILQNEFVLYFQPQYDVKTKKILSAEALIRRMHPTRGMVSPMKFIPIAEDTGLIIPLGDWILKEALRHVKIWEEMGLPKISVAVNLSAVQFQQEDLVGVVEKALDESGVGTDQLELELTESVVMQDARKADNILSRLSKLGIKLAIDDFGTGYSSLSYLKKFKVNRLKIDQSFVRDMTNNYDDAEIAHAIINLGHTLGLEIVSEGVETKEQLELLQKQGCDVIQGYFISKPIPASEIPAFLKKDSYYD